ETILEAFSSYDAGAKVRIRGAGSFKLDKLQGIESLDYLSIVEPLDIVLRIEQLQALKQGWLNGEGSELPPEGLTWFVREFSRNYPEQFILPHLYPTVAGGIRAEWTLGENEVSLEIDLLRHSADWHE